MIWMAGNYMAFESEHLLMDGGGNGRGILAWRYNNIGEDDCKLCGARTILYEWWRDVMKSIPGAKKGYLFC